MPGGLRAAAAAGLAALTLAGCAGPSPPALPGSAARPSPAPVASRGAVVGTGVPNLASLPGWAEEDHAAALAAFRAGCIASSETDMRVVCARARALGPVSEPEARRFLEANFRPVILPGPGLLTGYFSPEYPARAAPEGDYTAAVRPRPPDLVLGPADPDAPGRRTAVLQRDADGRTWPYPDRAGIELEPADDALAYVKPEDLFFLQIQGSGVLVLPDGRRLKAAYAADNGRPFVPIASAMVRKGLLAPDHASAGAIRGWLHEHPGAAAEALMDLDPRYVFFTTAPDDGREPTGAAGLAMLPGRSVAIDPAFHPYGQLFWVDGAAPTLRGAAKSYRRLVMAMDTGSAIRGEVRADLYLGRGEAAGQEAGRVRHTLLLVRLVPVDAYAEPPARAIGDEASPPP